jgi:hypothetical protein
VAKVDCLMGTYGRYSLVCESLACFLQQSRLVDATLLIYNQHPVPLSFDHPRVRVVNETPPAQPLRDIRHRMIELADPSAEFIHFWDDDDLYLPWHLEDCLNKVGEAVAWKPATSWMSYDNSTFFRQANRFEGSWIFRADYLRAAPLDTHPGYTDHPVYLQTVDRGGPATTDLGGRTSYIYRWANGYEHLSAYGGTGDVAEQRYGVLRWRSRSADIGNDGRLVAADLRPRWRQYLDGTRALVSRAEWALNSRRVGMESWR